MQKLGSILTLLLSSNIVAAQTPGFWLVGVAPGSSGSLGTSLSADGGIALGASTSGIAYTWTRENGRYDFGLEPGMPSWIAPYDLSDDGGILAGEMIVSGQNRAFRRVGNGPLVNLGALATFHRSKARGISGDGGTVVGSSEFGTSSGIAFRWTEQGGMQGLGYVRPGGTFSQANAISRDGTTIIGISYTNGVYDAFVWRDGPGMLGLPRLPGSSPNSTAQADAVNTDGSVIVGSSYSPVTLQASAVRWTTAGVESLGSVTGYPRSHAYAVSGSGDLIAGDLFSSLTGLPNTVFLWTPQTGMRLFTDYLSGYGISVPPGYRMNHVSAISDDGLTFTGNLISLSSGNQEAFVATVPAPPSSVILLLFPAMRRRRRSPAA